MLTRSEVARRLRRSVTTVRRIEGELLFPEIDDRGIYRFDESEVDALIDAVSLGHVRLWREVNRAAGDWRCWLARTKRSPRPRPLCRAAAANGEPGSSCSRCDESQRHAIRCAKENEALRALIRQVVEIAVQICPTTGAGTMLVQQLVDLVEEP
jgi:hypothetical protein